MKSDENNSTKNNIKSNEKGYNKKIVYSFIALNLCLIFVLVFFVIYINYNTKQEFLSLAVDMQSDDKSIEVIEEEFLESFEYDKIGAKFYYLKEFKKKNESTDQKSIYQNVGFFNEETGEGITLFVNMEDTEFKNIYEFMYAYVEGTKINERIPNESIIVYTDAKLDGNDAFKIKYRNSDGINVYQICTIYNNKQCTLLYSAKDEDFNMKKANYLFSKFEFLNK